MANHISIPNIAFMIVLLGMAIMLVSLFISIMLVMRHPWGIRPDHPFQILNPFYWSGHFRLRTLVFKKFTRPLSRYGYQKIDESKFGILWHLPNDKLSRIVARGRDGFMHGDYRFHWGRRAASREYIVEVKDATSGHTHYLPVPPCISAKGAVAWTFNMPESQYNPVLET